MIANKKRPDPEPLITICGHCKRAPLVYLALCEIASKRGKRRIRVSRLSIYRHCQVSFPTISKALNLLEEKHWLTRKHHYRNGKQYIIVTLLRRV